MRLAGLASLTGPKGGDIVRFVLQDCLYEVGSVTKDGRRGIQLRIEGPELQLGVGDPGRLLVIVLSRRGTRC